MHLVEVSYEVAVKLSAGAVVSYGWIGAVGYTSKLTYMAVHGSLQFLITWTSTGMLE